VWVRTGQSFHDGVDPTHGVDRVANPLQSVTAPCLPPNPHTFRTTRARTAAQKPRDLRNDQKVSEHGGGKAQSK